MDPAYMLFTCFTRFSTVSILFHQLGASILVGPTPTKTMDVMMVLKSLPRYDEAQKRTR